MVTGVGTANGIRNLLNAGFVGGPDVESLLRQRERVSGNGGFIWDGDEIAGRKAMGTNSAPAGTLVYGDWSSIAVASWGGLQLGLDSYTNFKSGIVGVRALWSCDVLVRSGASFNVATSIT